MNKYLLDTHVVLWIASEPSKISQKVRQALSDNSIKCVSISSAWEVAIKLGKNKLDLPGGLSEFYRMIDYNGFLTLPIKRSYLLQVPSLPNLHKDPFDRLIISTALTEGMTMVTADEDIQKYDIPWIW